MTFKPFITTWLTKIPAIKKPASAKEAGFFIA
jgi:hypothetical protein